VLPHLKPELVRAHKRLREVLVDLHGSLVQHDPKHLEFLIAFLDDPDAEVRARASDALAQLKERAEVAIPHLVHALSDTEDHVRRYASYALAKIGKEAVPQLMLALGNKDEQIRSLAAGALAITRAPDAVPIDTLAEALDDPSSVVRISAATALGRIGLPAQLTHETEEALSRALGEDGLIDAFVPPIAPPIPPGPTGHPVPATRYYIVEYMLVRIRRKFETPEFPERWGFQDTRCMDCLRNAHLGDAIA
jgi:hypothetical protein